MKRPCVESAPRHKIPYTGGRICSGVSYRIEPNTRPEINTIPSPVFFFLPCHPVPFVEYRNNFLGRKKKIFRNWRPAWVPLPLSFPNFIISSPFQPHVLFGAPFTGTADKYGYEPRLPPKKKKIHRETRAINGPSLRATAVRGSPARQWRAEGSAPIAKNFLPCTERSPERVSFRRDGLRLKNRSRRRPISSDPQKHP